jgi:hypothetical protein
MLSRERSEIVCLACGRVLGEVEVRNGALVLVENGRPRAFRVVNNRLFCTRCGGRGFVDYRMLAAS